MGSNNSSANMKLEPGMMCLVVGYFKSPVNVGKVVVLEGVAQDGDRTPSGGIFRASCSGINWLVKGDGLSTCVKELSGDVHRVADYAFTSEGHLMPIRPEEDPLEIKDVIIQKEKA